MLNKEQQDAVTSLGAPMLVVAGAGTGKTRVIIQKIKYLIKECEYKPSSILAVTFTNKAAKEMNQRVKKQIDCRGIQIATFHNFGLDFITANAKSLGLKKQVTLFDRDDSLQLLCELSGLESANSRDMQLQLNTISNWKSACMTAEDVLAMNEPKTRAIAALYASYQDKLKAFNAVDFDDLILLPVTLLQTCEATRDVWQNKFRHILVDEYQDTNPTQYKLLKLLAGPRAAFTLVGDDNQSIYAWRGADINNLQQVHSDYPNLKVVKLVENYRSTPKILSVANKLISNNPSMFPKELFSRGEPGNAVKIMAMHDDQDEVRQICSDILATKFQLNCGWDHFAILYRSNHQARAFEQELRGHQIPYVISGGNSFFSKVEIKDVIAYLRLMVNPDDDRAFLRIINTPRRSLGPKTVAQIANYANSRQISLYTASFEIGLQQQLGQQQQVALATFMNWLNNFSDKIARGDSVANIRDLLASIDYESWLVSTSSTPKAAEKRIESVKALIDWLEKLISPDNAEALSFNEAIQRIILLDIIERQQEEKATKVVHLMTLHAAKGLEFNKVYLAGVEEEILPHKNSLADGNIEEERRLAYVGITRAKQELILSYCLTRKSFKEYRSCSPSRFLDELVTPEVDWPAANNSAKSQQQVEEKGKQHLAAIKALLQGETTT